MASDTPRPVVPSIETVEYGRKALLQVIERYEEFERKAAAAGNHGAAGRFRAAHNVLRRELYGPGEDEPSCVITAFDRRWLTPSFRDAMTQVRESLADDPAVSTGEDPTTGGSDG